MSVVISAGIVCVALAILWNVKGELERGRVFDEALAKTTALTVLLAMPEQASGPSDAHQIEAVHNSLADSLSKLSHRNALEKSLFDELARANEELGFLLGQVSARAQAGSLPLDSHRVEVIYGQLWSSINQTSDIIYRLRGMSQARVASAQANAGISVFSLLIFLILSNVFIFILAGRRIEISRIDASNSEKNLRSLITEMSAGFALHEVIYDHDGTPVDFRFIEVNKWFESLVGLKNSDLAGKTLLEVFPNIERQSLEMFSRVALTGESATQEVFMAQLGKYYQTMAYRPQKHQLVAVSTDITQRMKMEAELRESVERNRVILKTATDGFLRTDMNARIMEVNDAYCEMSGYTESELLGLSVTQLEADEQPAEFNLRFRDCVGREDRRFESIHQRKDGSTFDVEVSMQCQPDYDGQIVVFLRDLTERRKAEEENRRVQNQFIQAQKMESIGRLAGGVAHDFNNMLSIILGYSDMALNKLDKKDPLYRDLMAIHNASERSVALTRQLLAFARKETIEPKVLDLNTVIGDLLKMLRRLIGEDIELEWKPAPELAKISMDPSQVDQVLANICINARDAISGVGRISMSTANETFDDAYCASNPGYLSGSFVRVSVADNGCGMDEETLKCIFEPFFTTKDRGKGTGLGLATVYGIAKQNHGFIKVNSEPGKGTVFNIYFRTMTTASEQETPTESVGLDLHGSETILFVEDEDMILELGKRMLEQIGYKVLTAASPSRALELAKEYDGPIHLLITDVILPGMNGKQLSELLVAERPDLEVLFMSGYTADVIGNHGVLDEGVNFLRKPFFSKQLAAKIRLVLSK